MRPTRASLAVGLVCLLSPLRGLAAPPEPDLDPSEAETPEPESEPQVQPLEGRVIEAGGSRLPVSGAPVMLVVAPDDARPGKRPREPLDPETVTWVLQSQTDEEGRFRVPEVPAGKVRIVIVAGGYERLEQYAEVPSEGPIELFVAPDRSGTYRTEVETEREVLVEPDHKLDAAQARHYAGSGDDPVLAALNLPGVARSPGGLGLLTLRGGNPGQTGVYLDGHPVPRAFHVIPIASVLSPSMSDRVELSPGNYGPGFGSFSGGMIHVFSRAGEREGIHGQAHVDLFDLGVTAEGPVGPGSAHFGIRRSHVDGVIRGVESAIGPTGILYPTYWDYLGRFDIPMPYRKGHSLSLRALGAGDRLRSAPTLELEQGSAFDYRAQFHRFDLDYRVAEGPWRVLLSPSIRLDTSELQQASRVRRNARVFSGRIEVEHQTRDFLSIHVGADLVNNRWFRTLEGQGFINGQGSGDFELVEESDGRNLRFGTWVATQFYGERWSVTPSLRFNTFWYGGDTHLRLDPRIEARGRVHKRVELFAKLGLFGVPLVLTTVDSSANLINQDGEVFGGVADVPPYLITYFDPGGEGEVRDGSTGSTSTIQAATGVEVDLPWDLRGRATLFWREVLPSTVPLIREDDVLELDSPRQRAMGLELFVRRELGPLDGWIGYTLLSSRQRRGDQPWRPSQFDQRHNLVFLLSTELPRNFRIGMRFRLVSGNPLRTVLGGDLVTTTFGNFYRPIRADIGTTYQPLFHQLDVRVDKRWVLRRTAVTAYLDVQNIYDRRYPEVYVYTADYSERVSLIGLPIYPSLGIQVDY